MASCEKCGAVGGVNFEAYTFDSRTQERLEQSFVLCVACARAKRRNDLPTTARAAGLTRAELIKQLDRFFLASGVFEICARCHAQGTGCCPPTCRVLGERGCDQSNKRGKTVFCSTFLCGALLNAIAECSQEVMRQLKWLKREVGPVEFRIYEMISRTPARARETERILALPQWYPRLDKLGDGEDIRQKLLSLADEVLETRRQWKKEEDSVHGGIPRCPQASKNSF